MIARRRFLQICTGAAWCWSGCSRPPVPLQPHTLLEVDGQTAQTLSQKTVPIPEGRWKSLSTGSAGFLLGDAHGLVTVPSDGSDVHIVAGPTDGLWGRTDTLITGQKVSADDYELTGRDPAANKPRWSTRLGYASILAATDKVVLVAHPKGVSAYDLDTGQPLWTNPSVLPVRSHFLGRDSLLVGGLSGEVSWLDLDTGQSRRKVYTDKDRNNRVIALASDGKFTLAFTRRVALFGFGPSGNKPVWRHPISPEEHESELLAWADSVVLVRLENSSVAFDLRTGKELWRCSLVARAAATSDTVVTLKPAARSLVNLEARDLRNGKVLWKKTSQFAATAALAREKSFYLLGDNFG